MYYLPRPTGAADLALSNIDDLHLEHPFMGARMLRDQLARENIHVGRRHIRTIMLRMGIEALAPQPGTSKAAPGNKIYPYLLRKLAIIRANQVWALDTTYIPMARGFVYLTAVVHVASRRVLTHKVAITLEACHAREIILDSAVDGVKARQSIAAVEHFREDQATILELRRSTWNPLGSPVNTGFPMLLTSAN